MMMTALWIVVGVVCVVGLLNGKTSRPDGTLVAGIHPYRRMLAMIMPRRADSVVYFDRIMRAEALLDFVEKARQEFHCDVTHAFLGAVARAFYENPKMNRFVVGHRLYQREGIFLSFSLKRKKKNAASKVSAVKLKIEPNWTFRDLCDHINQQLGVERSDAKTYQDKELGLLARIPRPLLAAMVSLLRRLDYYNLLPGFFIRDDAMYTSAFVANLGSLGMGAGFHHLYEWGTAPLFIMVGKIEERPIVENGAVVVRKMLHVRFSYDERIEDGLTANSGIESIARVVEDPFIELGSVGAAGGRPVRLGDPRAEVVAARATA